MKYFVKREFEKSDTADKLKIDNTVPEDLMPGLEEFVDNILDPLREAWGTGIKINSGYRSPDLNKAVKGSKTSSHCRALAADLWPLGRDFEKFKDFVREFLYARNWDQCIVEYSGDKRWLHIGYKNNKDEQRKQFLIYKDGKYSEWE
jgi:hypothetical protein